MAINQMETVQNLDYAAKWLRDGLHESAQAGAFEAIDVDTTEAGRILHELKATGHRITWTHIFVRAVSLTLARNPDLHELVAGGKKIHPGTVDICLSVAGDSSTTPTVIIEDAANKDILDIASEIARRTPKAVEETEVFLATLRRWGWILPLSMLRRGLIRFLLRRLWYRRKVSGTFQVSCLPQVDVFAPLLFNTSAALGVGRVRDSVIAINGKAVVRPVVTLTCCLDHSVWNGMTAARFLTSLKQVLENGNFADLSGLASPAKMIAAVAS